MRKIIWSRQARHDLFEILAFIARDKISAARTFHKKIFQKIQQISRFPKMGRIVPEFPEALLREILMGNYRLIYKSNGTVEIVTIHHSRKLLQSKE